MVAATSSGVRTATTATGRIGTEGSHGGGRGTDREGEQPGRREGGVLRVVRGVERPGQLSAQLLEGGALVLDGRAVEGDAHACLLDRSGSLRCCQTEGAAACLTGS